MSKRRARKTAKPKNPAPTSGISSARMHMLHTGPKVSPYMEQLMRKAIEKPSKRTLTIPVMDAIQRQMGNQFAAQLVRKADAADSADYTALRGQYDPEFIKRQDE